MAPEGSSLADPRQQDCPTSDTGSTHALAYRPSAGSTMSTEDSGYGSIGTDDNTEEDSQATPEARPTSPPQSESPTPQIRQRMFEGLFVFNPNEQQLRRYNEVLSYITPSLNSAIQKRARLFGSRKSKQKRVDGVRLIVMGPDSLEANATPHIVFFCSRDVGESIRELLEQPAWKRILRPDNTRMLSLSYKIVLSGITLKFFSSEFIAEFPEGDDPISRSSKLTNCGTPIHLYNGASTEWRRATLGGILEVMDDRGRVKCYAMTAGHQLDSWDDEESDQVEDDYANRDKDAWDFKGDGKYGTILTAGSGYGTYPVVKRYFDWAVFQMNRWKINAAVENDDVVEVSNHIQLPDLEIGRPVVGQVKIITASVGILMGVVQPGMAKIAIGPGEEVIDTYLVSISGDGSIANGDSGSWVVSRDRNQLLGHVVASDILGDIYVVPIAATLADIQFRLQAFSISLPLTDGLGEVFRAKVKAICLEAESLYVRAAGSRSICQDTTAEISSFENVLKHLYSEVRDPDSPVNGSDNLKYTTTYNRQLSSIIGKCSLAISNTGIMIDKYDKYGQQGPLGFPPLSYLEDKMRNKLSTLRIKIDTFLDTIQLYDTPSAETTSSPKHRQLDVVIDKLDKVLVRIWGRTQKERQKDQKGNWVWKERIVLEFRKEWMREGFPESALNLHKNILRAYVRELESGRWLDEDTPPFTRDILPQVRAPESMHSVPSLLPPLSHTLSGLQSLAATSNLAKSTQDERSEYTAFINTEELINIDVSTSKSFSALRVTVNRRVAPDTQGREIPLDAIWTKVNRRIISPQILERVGVRYEARPDFVAVLGVLSKETIIQWARLSAEARYKRNPDPEVGEPGDTTWDNTASTLAGSLSAKDPWESELQVWDSDLETWGLRDSESSDESDNEDDFDGKEKDDKASPPAKNQDLASESGGNMEAHRETESNKDGKGHVEGQLAGDGGKAMQTIAEHGHKLKPDNSRRVAQKKTAIRQLLHDVGIGVATVSLVRVLAETVDGS